MLPEYYRHFYLLASVTALITYGADVTVNIYHRIGAAHNVILKTAWSPVNAISTKFQAKSTSSASHLV
jgi:hypothetical protein